MDYPIAYPTKLDPVARDKLNRIYDMVLGKPEKVAEAATQYSDYEGNLPVLLITILIKNLVNNVALYKELEMKKHEEADEIFIDEVMTFSVPDKLGGYTKF